MSTDRNDDWSKLSWRYYAVDKAAQAALYDATSRTCECRLSSVTVKGEAILLTKFRVGLLVRLSPEPPDEYVTLIAQNREKLEFSISEIFHSYHDSSLDRRILTMEVAVTMDDSELKALRKLTCDLRLMERTTDGQ